MVSLNSEPGSKDLMVNSTTMFMQLWGERGIYDNASGLNIWFHRLYNIMQHTNDVKKNAFTACPAI